MDNIKKILNNIDFTINIDYGNDDVLVEKKHGGYLFNFNVKYIKEYSNYLAQTYSNPDEFDVKCTITGVYDLIVYNHKNNIIEIEEKDLEEMTEILSVRLVDTVL